MDLKQSRQKTGSLRIGLNGTLVATPQRAQVTGVSGIGRFPGTRRALHVLQRLGSFLNPLSR